MNEKSDSPREKVFKHFDLVFVVGELKKAGLPCTTIAQNLAISVTEARQLAKEYTKLFQDTALTKKRLGNVLYTQSTGGTFGDLVETYIAYKELMFAVDTLSGIATKARSGDLNAFSCYQRIEQVIFYLNKFLHDVGHLRELKQDIPNYSPGDVLRYYEVLPQYGEVIGTDGKNVTLRKTDGAEITINAVESVLIISRTQSKKRGGFLKALDFWKKHRPEWSIEP